MFDSKQRHDNLETRPLHDLVRWQQGGHKVTQLGGADFEQVWSTMSVKMKAGCVIWPSLAAGAVSNKEKLLLSEYAPLGLTLFRRNLTAFEQSQGLCADLRQIHRRARGQEAPSLVIAIDEEGGRVSRLPPPFPKTLPAAELAKRGVAALREQVSLQAEYARKIGVQMFFAPVCDLLTEPTNLVIGDRSFGETPQEVIPLLKEILRVLFKNEICPVLKHFPGHGDTKEDTHAKSAKVTTPLSLLRSREWEVFKQCLDGEFPVDAIMTCHVIVEALDPHWPATLSHELIGQVLRQELGFDGVIFSDDMRMNAIAEAFGQDRDVTVAAASDALSKLESAHRTLDTENNADEYLIQAARRALEVGVDVVLCCRGIEREVRILEGVARHIENDSEFENCVRTHAKRAWNLAKKWSVTDRIKG